MARTPAAEALAPMEPVTGRVASKAELKAHMQEVEAAHHHDSKYTAKVDSQHCDAVIANEVGAKASITGP